MGRLAEQAFAPDALRRAWADVLKNDADDGVIAPGVARFADEAGGRLTRLATDLAWGAYVPGNLTEVELPEDDKVRLLHVPTVADRVVARAVLDAITPLVDPALGQASYAYRPGLGVTDAVQAVARLRDEGFGWVLRTDIDDCFPSVPVALARRMLGALVTDDDVLDVVDRLLARVAVSSRRGRRVVRGLPQGCPLSPVLVNLVLASLDEEITVAGFPVVRYADDIVVAAESPDLAWEAARRAADAVRRLDMELGAEDTEVMSFADGFTFLGEDFGPRYPPVLADVRVDEPERKVVYVAAQGGRVRTSAGRLVVENAEDVEMLDVPTSHVGRVVCFGSVGVSAGVRSWALATGVDVVLASRRGGYLGSLVGGGTTRPQRVRAQVAMAGTPRALAVGRAIVEAKVRKQIVVLQRFGRREHADQVAEAIHGMKQTLLLLPDASAVDELMGLEGAAAAAYFPALGALFPGELIFTHRTRQPPLDVANSALSFLYTVLLGECVTASYAAGLDPAFGILHTDHDNRPSLALDLLEELRPLVVDQVVLAAARRAVLKAEHGRVEEGRAGVMLTKAGREGLLGAYERRMLTRTSGAIAGFAGTMRRHVYRQAQRLAASITDPGVEWTGMSWR